ncbi:MAG: cytochrome c, partial [Bacteroidota bacterium]
LRVLVLSLTFAVVLTACSDPDGNFTGSEYMPDMAHSLAMEANTYNYYYYNTFDEESTIKLAQLAYPRVPVKGTVPRGYASFFIDGEKRPDTYEELKKLRVAYNYSDVGQSVPTNGFVPYYFEDSDSGRLQAIAELIENPFPITEEGLERGKVLYNTFCGICHGEKGNGLGYIYDEEQNPNAKYPLAPANFIAGDLLTASNGRYYNAIMYGYNAMGAYKDKISFEERWQVIHYIRSLQAVETKTEYNQAINTLNPSFGVPLAEFEAMAGSHHADDEAHMEAAEQLSDDGHGDDHGNQQMRK